MNELRFHIEGPASKQIAQSLEAFLEAEFEVRPERREGDQGITPPGGRERTDPVAVAALIVAIPSGILAAMDLAERIHLKDKVQRLIEWVRKSKTSPSDRIFLVFREGKVLPLDEATPAQIMDAAKSESSKDNVR